MTRFSKTLAKIAPLIIVATMLTATGCSLPLPNLGDFEVCQAASECTGKPTSDCSGSWQCVLGQCHYLCENNPNPFVCTSDSECGVNQFCKLNCDHSKCDNGIECSESVCKGQCAIIPGTLECNESSDCAPGEQCENGTCSKLIPPTGCYGDNDCPSGLICNAAEVCDAPPECKAEGICPAVCYGQCVPPVKCKSIGCPPNTSPVDSNGDGCIDTCDPINSCDAAEILCEQGYKPVDTTGDGCLDSCEFIDPCNGIVLQCGADYHPVDTNDDGCPDQCEPIDLGCKSNQDCDAEQFCLLQACPDCEDFTSIGTCMPFECSTGLESKPCGNNEKCSIVACNDCNCPPNTDCDCENACFGFCESTIQFCNSNADCPQGESCQETGDPNCPECPVMIKQCLPVECYTQISCAPGFSAKDNNDDGCADACVANLCASNTDCGGGLSYCKKTNGACSELGKCAIKAQLCTDDYNPVCGCDGVTYSNSCEAASAGASVNKIGKCQSTFECTTVPSTGKDTCPDGFYCEIQVCDDCDGCECNGFCKPQEWECQHDTHCPPNHTCQAGNCVETIDPLGCKHDSDCAQGYVCTAEIKCLLKNGSDCFGECIDMQLLCAVGDNTCDKGFECTPLICTDGPNSQCLGVCKSTVEPECQNHKDCELGHLCQSGTCAMQLCFDDQNCPQGTTCNAMESTIDTLFVCLPKKKKKDKCVVSGCSGEICASTPLNSICEWQPWYACLELSSCQAYADDSGCGWTQNDAFDECMKQYGGF